MLTDSIARLQIISTLVASDRSRRRGGLHGTIRVGDNTGIIPTWKGQGSEEAWPRVWVSRARHGREKEKKKKQVLLANQNKAQKQTVKEK